MTISAINPKATSFLARFGNISCWKIHDVSTNRSNFRTWAEWDLA